VPENVYKGNRAKKRPRAKGGAGDSLSTRWRGGAPGKYLRATRAKKFHFLKRTPPSSMAKHVQIAGSWGRGSGVKARSNFSLTKNRSGRSGRRGDQTVSRSLSLKIGLGSKA